MTPESLVTVSWFGTPEMAEGDLRKLQRAGLNAYLGGQYHRYGEAVELRVPESEVPKAMEVLGIDPAELADDGDSAESLMTCPDCNSSTYRRLPAYALWAFVGSVVFFALSLLVGPAWIGGIGLLVGWVAALWLSRLSGRYRCVACGRTWKPE